MTALPNTATAGPTHRRARGGLPAHYLAWQVLLRYQALDQLGLCMDEHEPLAEPSVRELASRVMSDAGRQPVKRQRAIPKHRLRIYLTSLAINLAFLVYGMSREDASLIVATGLSSFLTVGMLGSYDK